MLVQDIGIRLQKQIYALYQDVYPAFVMTEELFAFLVQLRECTCLAEIVDGHMLGFVLYREDMIPLLIVRVDMRRRGIGSRLLTEAEHAIRQNGFTRCIIGVPDSSLFPGIVDVVGQDAEASAFFLRKGYHAGEEYADLSMRLREYRHEAVYPQCRKQISFHIYNGTKSAMISAVSRVDEDWTQFFQCTTNPIFAAEEEDRLLGFAILDFDAICVLSRKDRRIGSIGCVGVVPEARGCGIGLAMVANCTQLLKENGCTHAWIHYTYLEQWYAKLGYRTYLHFRFAKKTV